MTQTISASLPASTIYVSGTVNDVSVVWTNTEGEVWEAVADRAEDDIYVVILNIVSGSGQSSTTSFTLYYGLLNLITDRTQADVNYVVRLSTKSWNNMSEKEKADWESGLKGAYNASDLNRVGNAVVYVAGRLTKAGYLVPVSPKIDWTASDIPKESDMRTYLSDVDTLRNALTVLPGTPEVPEDMERLTYKEANDIERILLAVDGLITKMINSYFYSNEIFCGEV
jgi:hypothetical protein|nr:MAG TPA: hypothetical protein [Caudoviricetes sp.]